MQKKCTIHIHLWYNCYYFVKTLLHTVSPVYVSPFPTVYIFITLLRTFLNILQLRRMKTSWTPETGHWSRMSKESVIPETSLRALISTNTSTLSLMQNWTKSSLQTSSNSLDGIPFHRNGNKLLALAISEPNVGSWLQCQGKCSEMWTDCGFLITISYVQSCNGLIYNIHVSDSIFYIRITKVQYGFRQI